MAELIDLVKEYQRTHAPVVGDNIVRAIYSDLRLYISLRVPESMVDDILQETLISIFLGIDRFKGNTNAQFYAYCYTIARNKVADALRRREREPEFQFPEEEFWDAIAEREPPLTKKQREELESVMDLLAEVRPPCLVYLIAHYIQGMTYKEMHKEFGFPSTAAARMATSRCLRLAKEMGEE